MLIYKATNTVNGKIYIGQTTRTLKKRMSEHKHNAIYNKKKGNHFYSAIRKYGWDAFKWEVIEECNSVEEMEQAEKKWITHYKSNDREYGYNKSTGGEHSSLGVIRTDAQKRKIAETLRTNVEVQLRQINKKGQAQIGERNSQSKLTTEEVSEIKTLFYFSNMTDAEIAQMYGVGRQAINKIRKGQRWSWLTIFEQKGVDAK